MRGYSPSPGNPTAHPILARQFRLGCWWNCLLEKLSKLSDFWFFVPYFLLIRNKRINFRWRDPEDWDAIGVLPSRAKLCFYKAGHLALGETDPRQLGTLIWTIPFFVFKTVLRTIKFTIWLHFVRFGYILLPKNGIFTIVANLDLQS